MSSLPRSWEVDPRVESFLGVVGAVLALCLFLSPLCARTTRFVPRVAAACACWAARRAAPRRRTFQRIVAKRSTEAFSGVPYVLTAVQCAAWVLYCLLTPGRVAPGVTNGLGVVIEARARGGAAAAPRQ
jgi:hypothetical protein